MQYASNLMRKHHLFNENLNIIVHLPTLKIVYSSFYVYLNYKDSGPALRLGEGWVVGQESNHLYSRVEISACDGTAYALSCILLTMIGSRRCKNANSDSF